MTGATNECEEDAHTAAGWIGRVAELALRFEPRSKVIIDTARFKDLRRSGEEVANYPARLGRDARTAISRRGCQQPPAPGLHSPVPDRI